MTDNKKVNLSPRLKTIADFVIQDKPMADIGSDHAYLPLYLIQKSLVPSVIATELRKGPGEKAKKMIDFCQLEGKIELRLGDGLKPLKPKEVATVVLAGMGAQTIIKILTESKPVLYSVQRLVIQPMTEIPLLRKWLYQNQWKIVDEEIVKEENRYYIIIVAEQGEEFLLDEIKLELGPVLLAKKHPFLGDYVKELLNKERIVIKKLKNKDTIKALTQKQLSEAKIQKLQEVLEWD